MTTDNRLIRAARNQSLFREINERVEDLNGAFNELVPLGDWVCECADDACTERMAMTIPEYEAVREHATWFAMLPGHEQPEVERLVKANERYAVVEMIGEAAAFARTHDPRSDWSWS
jgi:hypothetical protein